MSFRKSVFLSLLCVLPSCAQHAGLVADHANGVYKQNEPIRWSMDLPPEATGNTLKYTIRKGGLTEIEKGEAQATNGVVTLKSKLSDSDTVLVELKWGNNRDQRSLGGAVVAPEKITPSTNRPTDFDQFWDAKIKDLQSVPANPTLELIDLDNSQVDYFKITMDNIRGSHIHGQLARPKQGDKFPALLIVQWAGVYPLQRAWVTNRAAQGWLALNIEAHDIPIDEPQSFYDSQSSGPLKNYPALGNDDRESSYFLRMYLSCYRAAQYLTERSDWDGRTLVVTGDSQGGMQTFITAAIHPKITAGIANVPAGCDLTGPVVGRKDGWPQPFFAQGKDPARVHEAMRYFDVMNFASRIKCPMLIGLGLIDETCPPAGIFAAANQLTAPKEIVILPVSGHQDVRTSQEPFRQRREKDWLPALQKGQAPPIAQN